MNSEMLCSTKTEILWSAKSRHQYQLPTTTVLVDANHVSSSTFVHILGNYTDSYISMKTRAMRMVLGCFTVLLQLRSTRPSVPDPVFQSVMVSLVLMRLDHDARQLTCLPTSSTAVCPERCSTTVGQSTLQVQIHHLVVARSPLALVATVFGRRYPANHCFWSSLVVLVVICCPCWS